MIIHLFNSTLVSGPETLVLPALRKIQEATCVIFLSETRRTSESMNPIQYAESLSLRTHSIRVTGRYDRNAVHQLSSLLHQLEPRIVHAHDVKASFFLMKAVEKMKPRSFQLFSTHHGVAARPGWKVKLYEQIYTHLVLPKFDRVLCVCTSDRNVLIRRGLDPRRVSVHLNGVNRNLVNLKDRGLASRRVRAQWQLSHRGISADALIIGVVGRLAPEKRHDKILLTTLEIKKMQPNLDWHLLCFGTGPLASPLKTLAKKLDLENQVHWMGYRNAVGNEMAGFDLLFSLSDHEGLPINLLEAGWAGTPILATAVDGNLDLISSPEEGILVHPHYSCAEIAREALELTRDQERQRRMSQAIQTRVQTQFSESSWLSTLLELYSE
jgi:glycosyltransferase involved in cell wall biosynthesis